jgi:hypothetical protein
MRHPGVITAADVSCLVIPNGCIGLPTLAALEQGIPVIVVRGNTNIMKNDLTTLPWARNQLHMVENYLEALGVMAALKSGVAIDTLKRPLANARTIENPSVSRVTGRMQDPKHHNTLGFHVVEDCIRKPGDDSATHLPVHTRVHLGELLDIVERKIDSREKLLAKADSLAFVKCVTTGEIPPNLLAVDERKTHQPRRASGSHRALRDGRHP